MNSWFVNLIIALPEKDYVKLGSDARYLNAITGTSNSSWPFKNLQVLIIQVSGLFIQVVIFRVHFIKYHWFRNKEIITVHNTRGQYTYQVGHFGLEKLYNFVCKLMSYTMGTQIEKRKLLHILTIHYCNLILNKKC